MSEQDNHDASMNNDHRGRLLGRGNGSLMRSRIALMDAMGYGGPT